MPADASSKEPHCDANLPAVDEMCWLCGATLKNGEEQCWLCGAKATSAADAAAASEPATARSLSTGGPTASFSLATLMMFVTLVAVVCGVISIAPGVGVALALVLIPVLAHTAISARREEALGHSLRPGERIMLFFGSLALVVVAGVAASIAFGATCFAAFFAGAAAGEALGARGYDSIGWGAVCGLALGAIAGAFVGYRAVIALSRNSMWRREGAKAVSRRSKLILATTILLAAVGAVVFFFYGM